MGLTLLIGGLLGLLLIQIFRLKSWVLASFLSLHIFSVILALTADFYHVDTLFSVLVLMSTHGVLLLKQLRISQLLLLCVLLFIHVSAAFITVSISLMFLALFLVGLLVLILFKGESWFLILSLLLMVLMALFIEVNIILMVICFIWLSLMTHQLYLLMYQNPLTIDEDTLLAQIESAKTTERSRIYQNIHDDVGAELLQLIYQLENSEQQGQVKNIMNKLREAVASTAHINITLQQLLAEIVAEVNTRCELANIQFNHEIKIKSNPKMQQLEPVHLQRIIRELVNNCLKHAHASHIKIQASTDGENLIIKISDDGIGFQTKDKQGKGIKSLQQRVKAQGGTIIWRSLQPQGTEVNLTLKI